MLKAGSLSQANIEPIMFYWQSKHGRESFLKARTLSLLSSSTVSFPFSHTPGAHKHKSAPPCSCSSPRLCILYSFTSLPSVFSRCLFTKSHSHLSDWLLPRLQEDAKPLLKLLLPLQLGLCQYHPPTLIGLLESQAGQARGVGEWPREGRGESKGNKNSYQACWVSVCRWSLGL